MYQILKIIFLLSLSSGLMSKEITNKELIFIYNAKSGFINELVDFAHKIISPNTYDCNLCAITYGTFTMEKSWANYVQSLPVKSVFTYKDKLVDKKLKKTKNPHHLLHIICNIHFFSISGHLLCPTSHTTVVFIIRICKLSK